MYSRVARVWKTPLLSIAYNKILDLRGILGLSMVLFWMENMGVINFVQEVLANWRRGLGSTFVFTVGPVETSCRPNASQRPVLAVASWHHTLVDSKSQ